MSDLQSELSLVVAQINEQQAKASKSNSDLEDARTRAKFLTEISNSLHQEQNKLETILAAANEL